MDARVKKDEHLEIQKKSFEPHVTFFYFLNIRPFSPGGFFTFLVALAHGAPRPPPPYFNFDRSVSTVQGGAYYTHHITNAPSPPDFHTFLQSW